MRLDKMRARFWLQTASIAALNLTASGAMAAEAAAEPTQDRGAIAELIVTAQKREEAVNSIPMAIVAASGEELQRRGINSPADLERLAPGFVYSKAQYNNPVYSIRGVGFYEASLAASPAVSVYVDEVPLAYSSMTTGVGLEVERVEVLKGPQGTLFGQNSTGGAINYVARKPTESFEAGVDASYGRFNALQLQGFMSGPVSDTLGVRLALRTEQGGAWQKNYTGPGDLGDKNLTIGRVLLEWRPNERTDVVLNLNGWADRSETQSAQMFIVRPRVPGAAVAPAVRAVPVAPAGDARAASWNPNLDFKRNDSFFQGTVRGDFNLADAIVLTSLSSYSEFRADNYHNFDGLALVETDAMVDGKVRAASQELRLTGTGERLKWILGANYSWDKTAEEQTFLLDDGSSRFIAGRLASGFRAVSDQKATTAAIFGNADFEIADGTRIEGGFRYTKVKRDFAGCTRDPGNGELAAAFVTLQTVFKTPGTPIVPIPRGGCYTLDNNLNPAMAVVSLDEDNVSWRIGVNHTWSNDALVYATVSRGYKAGAIPTLSAAQVSQYTPVVQESVLAYEAGVKLPLLDRTMQLNASLFHYAYDDKQLRGRQVIPFFGATERLLNIPKSTVQGADVQLLWSPTQNLDTSVSAVYVDSKVKNYIGTNADSNLTTDFRGSPFPYTPKWQVVADAQFHAPVNDKLEMYVGGTITYHSSTNSVFVGRVPSPFGTYDLLKVNSYALVDLRAGVQDRESKLRVGIFVRNLTNEYYFNGVNQLIDEISRFTGAPRTYGVELSYRM